MKKRILALFLASIMLCSAAACSNGTESLDDETMISTTASTVPEETQAPEALTPTERRMLIPDDLPDKKFDGRSYIIAVDPTKVYEISLKQSLRPAHMHTTSRDLLITFPTRRS